MSLEVPTNKHSENLKFRNHNHSDPPLLPFYIEKNILGLGGHKGKKILFLSLFLSVQIITKE